MLSKHKPPIVEAFLCFAIWWMKKSRNINSIFNAILSRQASTVLHIHLSHLPPKSSIYYTNTVVALLYGQQRTVVYTTEDCWPLNNDQQYLCKKHHWLLRIYKKAVISPCVSENLCIFAALDSDKAKTKGSVAWQEYWCHLLYCLPWTDEPMGFSAKYKEIACAAKQV